jgi:hypothetical protein
MTLFTLRINILLGVVEHEQKHFNGPLVSRDGGKKRRNKKTQEILKQPHIEILVAFRTWEDYL